MWITNGKTWYSEEDIQQIVKFCTNVIEECRAESGHNAYAGGRCITAEQILEIIEGINGD